MNVRLIMRDRSETFADLFAAWRRFPSDEWGQIAPALAMTLTFVLLAASPARRP